jgi:hypothetical protein
LGVYSPRSYRDYWRPLDRLVHNATASQGCPSFRTSFPPTYESRLTRLVGRPQLLYLRSSTLSRTLRRWHGSVSRGTSSVKEGLRSHLMRKRQLQQMRISSGRTYRMSGDRTITKLGSRCIMAHYGEFMSGVSYIFRIFFTFTLFSIQSRCFLG